MVSSVLAVAGCGPIFARGGDVPYVQTPAPVVEAMLALGEVGPDDFVYDLGAGDGRIVIAAARWRGARGVGIEIDPDLVRQARRAAERAGVADRVRFETRDLFTADLRGATAVTLYLSPDLNARLRPRLLAELRPGARIVAHDFEFSAWKPDKIQDIDDDGEGRSHRLYLYKR